MKKYFRFIFIVLIFYFLSFIFVPKISAVTETDGDLQVSYDEPLFPSSIIWYPGLTVTKSITVKNIGSSTHTTSVKADNSSHTGDVANLYLFKITEGGTGKYGGADDKTIKKFWDAGEVNLSDIGAGGSTSYDITITMPATAGNQYQGKIAKFDLIIGFAGGQSKVTVTTTSSNSPTVFPTAVPTVSPTLIPPGEILGSTTGAAEITITPTPLISKGQVQGVKTSRFSKKLIVGSVLLLGSTLFLVYFLVKKP